MSNESEAVEVLTLDRLTQALKSLDSLETQVKEFQVENLRLTRENESLNIEVAHKADVIAALTKQASELETTNAQLKEAEKQMLEDHEGRDRALTELRVAFKDARDSAAKLSQENQRIPELEKQLEAALTQKLHVEERFHSMRNELANAKHELEQLKSEAE